MPVVLMFFYCEMLCSYDSADVLPIAQFHRPWQVVETLPDRTNLDFHVALKGLRTVERHGKLRSLFCSSLPISSPYAKAVTPVRPTKSSDLHAQL